MTYQVKAGANAIVNDIAQLPPLVPFAESILAFCRELSDALLKQPQLQQHKELAALGFWLRNANMQRIQQQAANERAVRKALGMVVHFAPANVDTQFIYSWVCSLLLGNSNIVRLSSKESQIGELILGELQRLFASSEFDEIAQRNSFVQYPHNEQITAQLCGVADARVMWGGDDSVNAIRQFRVPPRCRDIAFAGRLSAALINGNKLTQNDVEHLAERLWRDTAPFAQQACSSPTLMVWLGATALQAELFEAVGQLSAQQDAAPFQRTEHLVYSQLLQAKGIAKKASHFGNVVVVEVNNSLQAMALNPPGYGCFLLTNITELGQLAELCDKRMQTLSYWGVDDAALLKLISQPSITGIDRITPIGQALQFSTQWDGYDLIEQLSRSVAIG